MAANDPIAGKRESMPMVTIGDAARDASTSPDAHHHKKHIPERRLRQLLRPNGRRVHVAPSPDEVDNLRKTISQSEKAQDFDLVVHGSNEHLEVLREAYNHQETTKLRLREKHGEVMDDIEEVLRELNVLNAELRSVTDHAVQLDANFSKFGYSAHLRTRDSPAESAAVSTYGDSGAGSEKHDWDADKTAAQTMSLWKKPVIRQYFHKGLLWRTSELQEVASYELFTDLLYVGIIDIAGENAAEHADGATLLNFCIIFMMGWKFWSDLGQMVAWYDADDISRRITVLFILTCLLGFTTNMVEFHGETYTPLVAFFLAERTCVALHNLLHAYLIPMVRPIMIIHTITTVISIPLWIGSIHVPWPSRYALIWIALVWDLTSFIIVPVFSRGMFFGSRFRAWAKQTVEFVPGVNIEHRIERMGAFVTLVFGFSVLSILYQSVQAFGINGFFGKACLGLVQAFTFNWLYFEVDNFNLHTHGVRRSIGTALLWNTAHLFLILSYVISSAALSVLVLAYDFPGENHYSLSEADLSHAHDYITPGQRWFFCAGLGIALASMGIISLSHEYKIIANQRLRRPKRLAIRFGVAVVMILLPLTTSLNSLHLIATTTCLVVIVLIVDLAGSTCPGDGFLAKRRDCRYSARCQMKREELEDSVRRGRQINVEELAGREGERQHGGATVRV